MSASPGDKAGKPSRSLEGEYVQANEVSVAQFRLAGGAAAALMGAALILPVVFSWLERERLTGIGIGFIVAGGVLIVCGATAVVLGLRRRGNSMPSSVRAVVTASALMLVFLGLELSDRSVRQDGKLFYWTTFLLLPTFLLFVGLVAGRRWAWWVARGMVALGVIWFLGFLAMVPFAPLQADGVPAPWYGRVYVAGATAAFAVIFAVTFRSLGRPEARAYFGVIPPVGVVEPAATPDPAG